MLLLWQCFLFLGTPLAASSMLYILIGWRGWLCACFDGLVFSLVLLPGFAGVLVLTQGWGESVFVLRCTRQYDTQSWCQFSHDANWCEYSPSFVLQF